MKKKKEKGYKFSFLTLVPESTIGHFEIGFFPPHSRYRGHPWFPAPPSPHNTFYNNLLKFYLNISYIKSKLINIKNQVLTLRYKIPSMPNS